MRTVALALPLLLVCVVSYLDIMYFCALLLSRVLRCSKNRL